MHWLYCLENVDAYVQDRRYIPASTGALYSSTLKISHPLWDYRGQSPPKQMEHTTIMAVLDEHGGGRFVDASIGICIFDSSLKRIDMGKSSEGVYSLSRLTTRIGQGTKTAGAVCKYSSHLTPYKGNRSAVVHDIIPPGSRRKRNTHANVKYRPAVPSSHAGPPMQVCSC